MKLARAVQRQVGLLLDVLDGHKVYSGAGCGLADGTGVSCVVFAALDVGLDVLGCDQAYVVAHGFEFAGPVVGTGAGFHRYDAGRLQLKEFGEFVAPNLLVKQFPALRVCAVDLEYVLGQI
jgi:hypothetical protein